MTIHNLKFQGVWNIDTFKYNTALPDYMFTSDKLEFHKDANMLKGGLVYADYITTVSETYAEEIKYPFYGEQLDGLLRARAASLRGIVNGIDYKIFDPNSDSKIYVKFNEKDVKDPRLATYAKLLFDSACLMANQPVANPLEFAKQVASLMADGLK